MSKVSMLGTITCQDGKADEMAGVLATMVEAARDEPGVEIYSYHRGDENTFWQKPERDIVTPDSFRKLY